MNLEIVRIRPEYCNYLRKFDKKVTYNMQEKETRPFVGILFEIENLKYFAPLTSPKNKHEKMKNTLDFMKLKNGELGAINFNNMIPVVSAEYELIDLNKSYENTKDVKYYKMLKEQLNWLNSKSIQVRNKAVKLYKFYNESRLPENIRARCCNFKLLEQKSVEYVNSN